MLHDEAGEPAVTRTSLPEFSRTAARLSVAIVAVVCLSLGAVAYTSIVGRPDATDSTDGTLSLLYLLLILGIQLGYFSNPLTRLRLGITVPALVVQGCLSFLPILQFGALWAGFPGFFAGSLLIALRSRLAVPLFVLVVAATVAAEWTFTTGVYNPVFSTVYIIVSTLLTGLVVYGLTRQARLVYDLYQAQEYLGRMAVAEERLRLARNVHDLLGMSLSAITLKAELSHRLVDSDPERARNEIAELMVVCRRALGEVRILASGVGTLSLDEELASVRAVLVSADIDAEIDARHGGVTDETGALLATVVREAITNTLRHSKAERCWIRLERDGDRVTMTIENDGVREAADDDVPGRVHRGLANLEARITDVGGTFEAGPVGDERYRLSASLDDR